MEIKFRYFADGKLAKLNIRFITAFLEISNDSLYHWNSKIKIRLYLILWYWQIWTMWLN